MDLRQKELEELYSLEGYLNREGKKVKEEIKEHRLKYDIRCKNCKTKLRAIKNDFNKKELCKTCWSGNSYIKENRKDIYGVVKGKWEKIKYKKGDWWVVK
jgi:hypothetical protein